MSSPPHEGIVSWPVVVQRIAIGVAAAATIGGGSMILSDNRQVSLHEQRISKLEQAFEKVPDIDTHVLILNGKVDVLNQKLDDATAARQLVATATAKASK